MMKKGNKKICTKCRKEFLLEFFHMDLSRPDGLCPYCKECSSKRNREIKKKYFSRNKERRRRELHPLKVQATRLIQQRILSGKLKREPCLLCGTENKVEAHHLVYEFKDKIIWLCRKHHRQHHREMKYL